MHLRHLTFCRLITWVHPRYLYHIEFLALTFMISPLMPSGLVMNRHISQNQRVLRWAWLVHLTPGYVWFCRTHSIWSGLKIGAKNTRVSTIVRSFAKSCIYHIFLLAGLGGKFCSPNASQQYIYIYIVLSNVIMVDEKLASFHQYLRYSHKCGTILFSILSPIIWA